MTAQTTPRVTISLNPDGTLSCEAAGDNGARRKIDLTSGSFERQIRAELSRQEKQIRKRRNEATHRLQVENVKYVMGAHAGAYARDGVPLLQKCWPGLRVTPKRFRLRSQDRTDRVASADAIAKPAIAKPKTKKPAGQAVDIDINLEDLL